MATSSRGPMARKPKSSTSKKKFAWKPADKSWHPSVIGMYNSLKTLEHSEDFEASDMWFARLLAQEHSDAIYNSVEKNAALLKMIFAEWKELGVTLATRRRLAIESEKVEEMSKTGEKMAELARQIVQGAQHD